MEVAAEKSIMFLLPTTTTTRSVAKQREKSIIIMSIRTLIAACLLSNLLINLNPPLILLCNSQKSLTGSPHITINQQRQQQITNNNIQPVNFPPTNITSSSSTHSQSRLKNVSNSIAIEDRSAADWFILGQNDLNAEEGKNVASFATDSNSGGGGGGNRKDSGSAKKSSSSSSSSANKRKGQSSGKSHHHSNKTVQSNTFDDEQQQLDSTNSNEVFDDVEEGSGLAGIQKEPDCASQGRYYCTYKEDYPLKLVTEVTKYYKWPLEKLFRDLHAQIMPKLAQDSTGNLVCDSITRVVRPGWARNTNDRWLVVINTENYHQYVTEVVCQYGSNSRCNFIPPCYYSSCQQRYNTQKLLVIDPANPYRGPFLSEFLFPSCCVCYVPSASDTFQDKYRSSPATIYQRTMQQESANNLYPPQFPPTGLMVDMSGTLGEQSAGSSTINRQSGGSQQQQPIAGAANNNNNNNNNKQSVLTTTNMAAAPGEIRREGDQYKQQLERLQQQQANDNNQDISSVGNGNQNNNNNIRQGNDLSDFPRLGLSDPMMNQQSIKSPAVEK